MILPHPFCEEKKSVRTVGQSRGELICTYFLREDKFIPCLAGSDLLLTRLFVYTVGSFVSKSRIYEADIY